MGFDPYGNPEVKKRMMALQQQKYRQGHRNGKDTSGNGIYTLTEEDKISCLDPKMQQLIREEKGKLKRLEAAAAPFEFSIGIGNMPESYVLTMKAHGVGFARREGPRYRVDAMKNPEGWFMEQIKDMKKELGYLSDQNIDTFVKMKKEHINQFGSTVTDKRVKKKPAPLTCPDHGNRLVPGEEADTLVCTVYGCKKVARKKKKEPEDAVPKTGTEKSDKVEPEPSISIDDVLDVEEPSKILDTIDAQMLEKQRKIASAGPVVPIIQGNTPAAVAFNKLIQQAASPNSMPDYVNDNQPKLVTTNGRHYLTQETGSGGRRVSIDVTSVIQAIAKVHNAPGQTQRVEIPAITMNGPGNLALIVLAMD